VLVRADGDPARLGADVRRVLMDLDPGIRYVTLNTIQASIDPQTQSWRIGATVFGLSGLLALLVAAVGLYSVMSYLVADQAHEIGVRIALGARRADIVRLVLRGSVVMAVAGIGLGAIGALAASGVMQPLLFKVSARDPWVYGAAAGVLVVVALVAGAIPSMRANRIDPLRALQAE
jgi:ABC-type antimicrobial peptide transport system permease subunit